MLQLKNTTPFASDIAVFPDEHGIDSLYVNIKATFKIGKQWMLADEQVKPQQEDVYWGEPGKSSLRYPSDFHLGKAGTDILVVGSACSQGNVQVRQLDVGVQVANHRKTIRVFGDRVWSEGRISAPQPFQSMPMVFERAFGGVSRGNDDSLLADARNPVGCGIPSTSECEDIDGTPLPNLENPAQLITSVRDRPYPACLSALAPNWQPRAGYAGTFDEQWQQTRAPFVPVDFNRRFNNAASPDFVTDGFLTGGEPVKITNMHPSGVLSFRLPHVHLVGRVELGTTTDRMTFNLETVLLEPNALRLSLVWKAKHAYDKRILKVKNVSVSLAR